MTEKKKPIKLKKIKVGDMLDDRHYWVKGEGMIYLGSNWKTLLNKEKEVEVHEFKND